TELPAACVWASIYVLSPCEQSRDFARLAHRQQRIRYDDKDRGPREVTQGD
ncbi:MAG: hypothetical protein ACI82F_002394, partial [Planctomycetota bacterium]